jgi:di/tricarboxylate transporter
MSGQLIAVLLLLVAAIVMFAINRPRMDVVALLMIALLPFTGTITVPEAISGLSDANVVLIALMFVIGEGLVRTGAAQRLGDLLIARSGPRENLLVVMLMVIVAAFGSFMSSTGVVAIFIPVVLRICKNTGIAPKRLLMPLSVAALISGMMTLVATSPNLVVNAEIIRSGANGFGFFTFTPFGIPVLIIGVAYMLVARRCLRVRDPVEAAAAARPTLQGWVEEYGLAAREHRARIKPGSPLIGKRIGDLNLREHGVNVLIIEREGTLGREHVRPTSTTELAAGDSLFLDVAHPINDPETARQKYGLEELPLSGNYFNDRSQEIGMAEVIVPAGSRLVGKSVVQAGVRGQFKLTVIGLKRGLKPLSDKVLEVPLKVGDTLLVIGRWRAIRSLRSDAEDLIAFNLPSEFYEAAPAARRAPFAVGALLVVVGLMAFRVVPNVQAALIGCLLMGLFKCVTLTSAYRAISWPTLILIVGMLPFSIALQRTGGVELTSSALLNAVGARNPHVLLAAVFMATSLLSLFISNTATAVLMAPVAISVANHLGASPYPFAMTVALAASTAFMTPISSPVNTLIVGPGGYSFMDFIRIGVPLAILTMITCLLLIPVFLPL